MLALALLLFVGGSSGDIGARAPLTGGGRFVFGQVSDLGRDKFLLDTQAGRLWQIVCVDVGPGPGECKQLALEEVPFVNASQLPSSKAPAIYTEPP